MLSLASAPGIRRRLAIAACFAAMFMMGVTISLLGPSLPGLAAHSGITLPQAGIFFTLFSAGAVVATLGLAQLNDRPVRFFVMLFGGLLLAAGLVAIATGRTFFHLAVAIAVSGLALSSIGTVPNAIFVELFRERAGQALNLLHISVGIGSFAGPLLVSVSYRLGSDYRPVYQAAAAAMLVVALVWGISRPPGPAPHAAPRSRSRPAMLFSLLLVFFLAFLYTGTEQILGGWLFTYGRNALGRDAVTAGLANSLFWFAVLIGRLLAVRVLRSRSNTQLIAACLTLGIAGVTLILLARVWLPAFWLGLAVTGTGFGPVFPTALALSGQLAPQRSGAVGTFVVASGSIGASILPLAAGSLIPLIGVAGSIALAYLPLLLMGLCLAAIASRLAQTTT